MRFWQNNNVKLWFTLVRLRQTIRSFGNGKQAHLSSFTLVRLRQTIRSFGNGKQAHLSSFTLVELLAAVAIVGVLAMVAIPRYKSHMARARQAEATVNLGEIKSLQAIYLVNQFSYHSGLHYGLDKCGDTAAEGKNGLGFRLSDCSKSRYRYITNDGNDCAKSDGRIAEGQVYPGCAADDVWTITPESQLTNLADVVKQCPGGVSSPPSSGCTAVALPPTLITNCPSCTTWLDPSPIPVDGVCTGGFKTRAAYNQTCGDTGLSHCTNIIPEKKTPCTCTPTSWGACVGGWQSKANADCSTTTRSCTALICNKANPCCNAVGAIIETSSGACDTTNFTFDQANCRCNPKQTICTPSCGPCKPKGGGLCQKTCLLSDCTTTPSPCTCPTCNNTCSCSDKFGQWDANWSPTLTAGCTAGVTEIIQKKTRTVTEECVRPTNPCAALSCSNTVKPKEEKTQKVACPTCKSSCGDGCTDWTASRWSGWQPRNVPTEPLCNHRGFKQKRARGLQRTCTNLCPGTTCSRTSRQLEQKWTYDNIHCNEFKFCEGTNAIYNKRTDWNCQLRGVGFSSVIKNTSTADSYNAYTSDTCPDNPAYTSANDCMTSAMSTNPHEQVKCLCDCKVYSKYYHASNGWVNQQGVHPAWSPTKKGYFKTQLRNSCITATWNNSGACFDGFGDNCRIAPATKADATYGNKKVPSYMCEDHRNIHRRTAGRCSL